MFINYERTMKMEISEGKHNRICINIIFLSRCYSRRRKKNINKWPICVHTHSVTGIVCGADYKVRVVELGVYWGVFGVVMWQSVNSLSNTLRTNRQTKKLPAWGHCLNKKTFLSTVSPQSFHCSNLSRFYSYKTSFITLFFRSFYSYLSQKWFSNIKTGLSNV